MANIDIRMAADMSNLGISYGALTSYGSTHITITAGLTGADTLLGNGGDDLLIGGAGVDRMEGGGGNDRYIVDDSRDVVIEAPGAGTDHVFAATGYRLGDGIERLSLTGAAAWGVGNALDNVLTGTDGANVLNGGLGRDRLCLLYTSPSPRD